MNIFVFLFSLLIILIVAILFYLKKRKIFFSLIFFLITLFLLLSISTYKFRFSFPIRRSLPIYLLVDVSRSMKEIDVSLEKWKHFFDDTFYFSDAISLNKTKLNKEFSKIYDNIRDFRKKNEDCKLVVVTDLQDNFSLNKTFDPYNVYVIYTERKEKRDFFIYDLRISENIISGEPFIIELTVFSEKDGKKTFEIKDDNRVLFSKNLEMKKGLQDLTIEAKLSLEGFKKLTFGFKDSEKFERIINFTRNRYRIFIASLPSEEFVFLKRFLNQFKWIKTEEHLLKTKGKYSLNLDYSFDGYVFIDIQGESFHSYETLKKISNAIFIFTTGMEKNNLLSFLTNGEELYISNISGLTLLTMKGKKIICGESWKLKMKESLLEIKERKYERFWLELISEFFEGKEAQFMIDRYNYVFGEDSLLDTSSMGLKKFNYRGKDIPFLVMSNVKEDLILPLSLEETNWMNIINFNELTNIKDFVRGLKEDSKIIQQVKIELDPSKNVFFFVVIIGLMLIFWYTETF